MTSTTSRSKKVLAPLAVLLAAGALAVGSGATFTSASSNTIEAVTSGTLTHFNSKDNQAIFAAENLQPGESGSGSLTLKNTGSLDAALTLTETEIENTFVDDKLFLTVHEGTPQKPGAEVYSGPFGDLNEVDLGKLEVGQTKDFTFIVNLLEGAGNANQNQTASTSFSWDAIQINN